MVECTNTDDGDDGVDAGDGVEEDHRGMSSRFLGLVESSHRTLPHHTHFYCNVNSLQSQSP